MYKQKIKNFLQIFSKFSKTKGLGFSFVELVIMVTILAILGTISYVYFGSYTIKARDSQRISDLNTISKGLGMIFSKAEKYPKPDKVVNLTASGFLVGFQGEVGDNVKNIIKLSSNGGKDPTFNTNYTYATNITYNKYQLVSFLEDSSSVAFDFGLSQKVVAFDYSGTPFSKGDSLGIVINTSTGANGKTTYVPLQDTGTGIDFTNTSTGQLVIRTNNEFLTGITSEVLKKSYIVSKINGNCGTAVNVIYNSGSTEIQGTFCADGMSSTEDVSFSGTKTWICQGENGGTNATCNVSLPPIDGVCGSAANNLYITGSSVLSGSLCTTGNSSTEDLSFTGSPRNWDCLGLYGGNNLSCTAQLYMINGSCGTAANDNYIYTATNISGTFCSAGTSSTADTSFSGSRTWMCNGISGGSNMNCAATLARVNGTCGSAANDNYVYTATNISGTFCNSGIPSTADTSFSGSKTWSCNGVAGGGNVNCNANFAKIDGVCGTAANKDYTSASTILAGTFCSLGTSSTADTSFSLIKNWTCNGIAGGNNITCTAVVSWSTKAPMPTARYSFGVGVVNGKIYAIGGTTNGSGGLNIVEEYTPSTNTWSTKASMPTVRHSFGVGVVNGKIYAIGGVNNGAAYKTLEVYDPSTNTWSTKTQMPTARFGLSVESINNKIYAIGGTSDGSAYLGTTEEYDPSTDIWTTKQASANAYIGMGGGINGGYLYMIGGGYNNSGTSPVATLQYYDPITNVWGTKTAMLNTRYYLGSGFINDKLYAIGGYNGAYLNATEEYSPVTNTWTNRLNMPTARSNVGVGIVDNKMYVIGGLNGSTLNTVEEFNP